MRILRVGFCLALVALAGCDNAQRDWEEARAEGTEAAYERFLEQHSGDPLADECRSELQALRFAAARELDSIDAYEAFLEQHPKGDASDVARVRLDVLRFKKAEAADSPEGYAEFLKHCPEGKLTAVAREKHESTLYREAERLRRADLHDELLRLYPEGKHAEASRVASAALRAADAFREAQQEHTVEAYESFLAKHPKSEEAERARQEAAAVPEWEKAKGTKSLDGYRSVIRRFPGTSSASQAREALLAIVRGQALATICKAPQYAGLARRLEQIRSDMDPQTRGAGIIGLEKEAFLDLLVEEARLTGAPEFSLGAVQPLPGTKIINALALPEPEPGESTTTRFVIGPESAKLGSASGTIKGSGPDDLVTYRASYGVYPEDGRLANLKMIMLGRGKITSKTLKLGRIALRAHCCIEQTSIGYRLSTVLPQDLLAFETRLPGLGGFGRSSSPSGTWLLLPAGDGVRFCFRGEVKGFVPGATIVGDTDNPLHFALIQDLGLTYLAGKGKIVHLDGRIVRLPPDGPTRGAR